MADKVQPAVVVQSSADKLAVAELVQQAAAVPELVMVLHRRKPVYRAAVQGTAVVEQAAAAESEKTDVLPNLIANFEQKSAKWRGELVDSMSVSYGYVFSSEKEWNGIYDIAKAADARMYKSKSCYYRKSGIDRRR